MLKKYVSTDRGLTLKGFKDFWADSIKENGETTIWQWLGKLGYDRELYSNFSRSFIMTMHSESPLTL